MGTHGEQVTIRPAGFLLIGHLAAALRAAVRAWRDERRERAEIAALEALGPEMLDDIGVTIRRAGRRPRAVAAAHPHVIAIGALGAMAPKDSGGP
jgi:uncharacterized protein YjiS (DUF1127 family)